MSYWCSRDAGNSKTEMLIKQQIIKHQKVHLKYMKTHVELQGKVKGDTSHTVHQRTYWNFSDYKRLVIKISIKAISISPDSYCKLKLSRRSVWIIWMINLCCRTHCPTICALPWQSELTPVKMTLTRMCSPLIITLPQVTGLSS